jgi:hypothetical protein
MLRGAGPKRLDQGGNVRQRIEHAHQALDLLFRPMLGPRQDFAMILFGQVRAEQQDPREMHLTGCDLFEKDRKLPSDLRRTGAAEGFVFGQAKFVYAIRAERGARALAVNAAAGSSARPGDACSHEGRRRACARGSMGLAE